MGKAALLDTEDEKKDEADSGGQRGRRHRGNRSLPETAAEGLKAAVVEERGAIDTKNPNNNKEANKEVKPVPKKKYVCIIHVTLFHCHSYLHIFGLILREDLPVILQPVQVPLRQIEMSPKREIGKSKLRYVKKILM